VDLLGNCWSWNLACRAANTFNHDVIQPINRDVIRPVAHFAADFGRSVWHFASEFAQGVGNLFTGLIRGIGCMGMMGSPAAGVCSSAAGDQINQGNGQIWRGGGGLCLDLCPVKGGKYLAKIPVIRRTIDRFGHWIKPGETAAQRSARYGAETAPDYANIVSPGRTEHILNGDATGGGHMWPGAPGKTPFPRDWSGARIMHEVSDIATDPASTRVRQGGREVVTGTRGGVDIRVIVDYTNDNIITAYPTNLPRN
jgi:hypothetical protein